LWQQISDAKLTARKVSELDLSAGSPIPRGAGTADEIMADFTTSISFQMGF
jgi:hypothetical protein